MGDKVPQVLLCVAAEYIATIVYKVCNVKQRVLFAFRILVSLDDSPGDEADVIFSCEVSISLKIRRPLVAAFEEAFVFGNPVGQMV